MLQKKSTGAKPHYLDIGLPAHDDDEATVEKLVNNNIKHYAQFVIYPYSLNIMKEQYTEELRKIHGPQLEDLRLVPFNIDATYAMGGGTPYGRYVKILIIFHYLLSVHNT
jgi:hypothetical protein